MGPDMSLFQSLLGILKSKYTRHRFDNQAQFQSLLGILKSRQSKGA